VAGGIDRRQSPAVWITPLAQPVRRLVSAYGCPLRNHKNTNKNKYLRFTPLARRQKNLPQPIKAAA